MSIETLLEAAKFLEFQAQQQQKAREDEKEKLRLQHLKEQSHPNVNSTIHINNVSKAEELHMESRPPPIPSALSPPSVPITVIPIPVVTPNLTGSPTLPVTTLSPPAAPPLASPKTDSSPPLEQSAAALLWSPQPKPDIQTMVTANHKQPIQNHHLQPQLVTQTNNTKLHQQLVQRYPGTIVSPIQQQALLPHSGPVLQQAPLHNGPVSRGSPPDDSRHLDSKKRPGGRAHLKECFETLKKNIPNIDEKKTSNLSVLRSALRYIQTLKRKEKEYEHDMERLAREKIATQQRLAELKNDLSQWMDVIEIDRILRQTVQPEEDQASTSTASEGEDIMDDDLDEEPAPRAPTALPTVPQIMKPELRTTATPTQVPTVMPTTTTSFTTPHNQRKAPQHQPQSLPVTPPQPLSKPAAPPTLTATTSSTPCQLSNPTQTQMVTTPSLHPTVIAHAPVSHPSVIQVIPSQSSKNIAQLGPSTTTSSVQLAPGHQPISHITVHPVAHLSQHLPTLYSQPVAVTQPAVVGHITQTINHAHVNGSAPAQPAATIVGKQTAVSTQMMAHHPQLVGQTVLNPVTMVTMPSFPISTLKLA
ncbi:max-binding protein MNT isoform X2 [Neolamprologus brichardi]|uniref:max-binding protein MNT isoform X2 n=1 Tax=Neolamprologus brichardi TaxID=32507 RepID=UPI0003EBD8E5|nr:max-binding protein MNT isoform X2 [Neolamprologus brichardi]